MKNGQRASFSPASPILPDDFRAITVQKHAALRLADQESAALLRDNRLDYVGFTPDGKESQSLQMAAGGPLERSPLQVESQLQINRQFDFSELDTPGKSHDHRGGVSPLVIESRLLSLKDSERELASPTRKLILVKSSSEEKVDLGVIARPLDEGQQLVHPPMLGSMISDFSQPTLGAKAADDPWTDHVAAGPARDLSLSFSDRKGRLHGDDRELPFHLSEQPETHLSSKQVQEMGLPPLPTNELALQAWVASREAEKMLLARKVKALDAVLQDARSMIAVHPKASSKLRLGEGEESGSHLFSNDDRFNYDRPWLSYRYDRAKPKGPKTRQIPDHIIAKFMRPALRESGLSADQQLEVPSQNDLAGFPGHLTREEAEGNGGLLPSNEESLEKLLQSPAGEQMLVEQAELNNQIESSGKLL